MEVLNCEICGLPISEPEEGVLVIDERKWFEYRDELSAWEKRHRNKPEPLYRDLSDCFGKERVHWEWVHKTCEDKLEEGEDGKNIAYDIGGERISTEADALIWTLDLLEKRWFEWTDWRETIRKLFGLNGGV